MLAIGLYLCFVGASCAYALMDWRRGWLLVVLCGVMQDPVRKLTPGHPVWVSFLVVLVYATILFRARNDLIAHLSEFSRRFPKIYLTVLAFILLLFVAALNGLFFTYGFSKWKVPLLSLFTYCVPMIAIILGYAWLQREEMLYRFFRVYAIATSLALVGTALEYLRVQSPLIGLVAYEGDYIRHLPGIQIRLLSGFYRSPDIMALHAATLTAIGVAMAMRSGVAKELFLWAGAAGWGFLNCMIGGRRKAIYFVVVFVVLFLWRYFRRVQNAQVFALVAILAILGGVIRNLAASESTSVYARGALTTQEEITKRLEGGVFETFEQFGLMGAGLGTATQGVRHLLDTENIGWQEGGLGKLAIEVGLPGIVALALLVWLLLRTLMILTRIPDVPGSSQFARVTLFAMTIANAASFIASAQAYTDAVLALTTGFIAGCLFATAVLDERAAAAAAAAVPETAQLTAAATA